jgi:hypothetical protein
VRLQLIALALAWSSAAGADPGDPSARATFRYYADDDHVTVVSPGAAATAAIGERTTVDADVDVDVVTGASVDVITSASPATVHEQRVEAGVAGTRAIGGVRISALVRGSHERDYDSVRGGAAVRAELADHNTTIDVRLLGGKDIAGDVRDPDFRRTRSSGELVALVTQVLGPRTIASLVVDASAAAGYHASPYRRVPVVVPDWPTPTFYTEETPRDRASVALALRVRRAVGDAWFATADERVYVDDWGLASDTLTAGVLRAFGDRLLGGVSARGYVQDGARFYRGTYAAVQPYRTRDRTLGPMRSLFVECTADVALRGTWHLVSSAGVLDTWFLDFPAQADRRALVLTLSLTSPL